MVQFTHICTADTFLDDRPALFRTGTIPVKYVNILSFPTSHTYVVISQLQDAYVDFYAGWVGIVSSYNSRQMLRLS